MSKTFRSFPLVFAAAVLILQLFNNFHAQDIQATITIDADDPYIARVKGRFLTPRPAAQTNSLSFLSEYAGVAGLQKRFSDVHVGDGLQDIAFIPTWDRSSYVAVGEVRVWSFMVDLKPLKNASAAAHVSSISPDGGILMIDDLLPQLSGRSARIKIELPVGWKLHAVSPASGENEFEVPDIEKAAFFVGRNWRETDLAVGGASIKLLIAGEWMFTDEQAAAFAREIFQYYQKLFGSAPRRISQIAIVRLPPNVLPGNWEGDTRGASITIASSDMPFRSASLQRLHEQFRHEIFHLWVPGGVNLTGNYSWFYEGFALYQSLKMGVEVNRIRFEDMLDTLSRAYRIEQGNRLIGHPPQSLIDLSRELWNGANTQVYARGMLTAFLCDLAMLDASGGKRSTTDLLRDLYSQHSGPTAARAGNEALVSLFRSRKELVPIVDRYISGGADIDWETTLRNAGLETEGTDQATKLKATAKPSGRQKHLLDKLGYNSWRKLSTGTK